MNRATRTLSIIPALVATAVLAAVIYKGAITVHELRQLGETSWPLVSPLNAVPAAIISVSVIAFARGRSALAAFLGIMALAFASVFWLSQASGSVG